LPPFSGEKVDWGGGFLNKKVGLNVAPGLQLFQGRWKTTKMVTDVLGKETGQESKQELQANCGLGLASAA